MIVKNCDMVTFIEKKKKILYLVINSFMYALLCIIKYCICYIIVMPRILRSPKLEILDNQLFVSIETIKH